MGKFSKTVCFMILSCTCVAALAARAALWSEKLYVLYIISQTGNGFMRHFCLRNYLMDLSNVFLATLDLSIVHATEYKNSYVSNSVPAHISGKS